MGASGEPAHLHCPSLSEGGWACGAHCNGCPVQGGPACTRATGTGSSHLHP